MPAKNIAGSITFSVSNPGSIHPITRYSVGTFMKKYLAFAVTLLGMGKVIACTTLLVGNQASADGSFIIARNEDGSANNAKHKVIHPVAFHQQGEYKAHRNNFSWPLPETAMRYTAIHDFDTNDNAMGEAGFNSAGVGMSATETIYNGRAALAADPYVTKQESRKTPLSP